MQNCFNIFLLTQLVLQESSATLPKRYLIILLKEIYIILPAKPTKQFEKHFLVLCVQIAVV